MSRGRRRARRLPARDDLRGVALRRRRGHGGRPAGDRRQPDQPRSMDKVVEADRHSGVAIAGAAGPAMDMVRLFQLQLEHYEKVEGTALSLEGKANQLSMMIRGNLQAAMMGLGVVPIFAGYDLRRQRRAAVGLRHHRRALRGARVRRHGLGQPARRHGGQVRLPGRARPVGSGRPRLPGTVGGRRRRLGDGRARRLRGIYPIVATITAEGFAPVDDDELAERYRAIADDVRAAGGATVMTMPFTAFPGHAGRSLRSPATQAGGGRSLAGARSLAARWMWRSLARTGGVSS